MAQRTRGIGEADRGEPVVRLLGRERALLGGKRRHGGEQRPVEETDMDVADLALDRLPDLPHPLAGVGEARCPREHSQLLGARGHQMRAAQLTELHAVLEHAQHAVVAREGRGIRSPDVSLGDQGVQRLQRAALPDPIVAEAVDELQQLDGELDVADAAGPELDLVRKLAGGDVLGDPLAHALHVVDEVLARRARPHLRLDRSDVRGPELDIPRDGTGLQERLELPALRPAVVVRQVRVQRPHERALLALGPQIRIDLPERRLDLGARDASHRQHGEPRGDVDDTALSDLLEQLVVGTRDEDDIDVAHVVELAGARLAHADDREARPRDLIMREASRPRRRAETFVRATASDASSAAPAASARMPATGASSSTGFAARRSNAAIRASSVR